MAVEWTVRHAALRASSSAGTTALHYSNRAERWMANVGVPVVVVCVGRAIREPLRMCLGFGR